MFDLLQVTKNDKPVLEDIASYVLEDSSQDEITKLLETWLDIEEAFLLKRSYDASAQPLGFVSLQPNVSEKSVVISTLYGMPDQETATTATPEKILISKVMDYMLEFYPNRNLSVILSPNDWEKLVFYLDQGFSNIELTEDKIHFCLSKSLP